MENPHPAPNLLSRFEVSPARWALWLAAFLVFVVIMSGKVRYTLGDSRYSLLATTSLIEHGSFRLDPYVKELDLTKLNHGHMWMIFPAGKPAHYYYDYPIGTPIFSLPFVWVARQFGYNPIHHEDDHAMQIGLAAILCVVVFLLLYRLAGLFLGEWAALVFSLGIFFGTTLTSTMGSALWSHNFQTLFTLLAVLEIAEWERGKRPRIRGKWLGFVLFAAYLCRPTSAALVVAVFGYLAWRDRKVLPWVMGVSGGLFLLFVLWSWLELHMILPRYYDPRLWRAGEGFWEHILPLWFGPARGFWSFSPALLLFFGAWAFRNLRFRPLYLMLWVWLILHSILLMRSQSPWAGWSFGPRFFTEFVPGAALGLLLLAEQLPVMSARLRNGLAVGFVVLSGAGIYIHTFQGLNNIETQAWNDNPNIDQAWEQRRWDWRHPQFLASAYQRAKLEQETALELQIRQIVPRVPEGASIYYGPQDPNIRQCFLRWNRRDHFLRHQHFYNSHHALKESGAKTFWFSTAQLADIKTFPDITVDSSKIYRLCLGEFLAANERYEIFIAGKDDVSTGPALETRAYMRSIGSLLDSVKLRDSYIAHLKGGKVLHEEWGPRMLEYVSPDPVRVRVQSAGIFTGNLSSIVVKGRECSLNNRGMNVVVLDDKRNIVWITSFDTHGDDHEKVVLMEGKMN